MCSDHNKRAVFCWLSASVPLRILNVIGIIKSPMRTHQLLPDAGSISLRVSHGLGYYPAQAQYSFYVPPHEALRLKNIIDPEIFIVKSCDSQKRTKEPLPVSDSFFYYPLFFFSIYRDSLREKDKCLPGHQETRYSAYL